MQQKHCTNNGISCYFRLYQNEAVCKLQMKQRKSLVKYPFGNLNPDPVIVQSFLHVMACNLTEALAANLLVCGL